MGKRIAVILILLAFLAPALPALCRPGAVLSGPVPALRAVPGAGFAGRLPSCSLPSREFLAALARLSRVLDAVDAQEAALASVLGADRPEDVRECEERLQRRREPLIFRRRV
jgi:hypothetical protein